MRRSCCEREQLFGEIVRIETGKPWKNAVAEVASSADLAVFMEGEGSRCYGKTMPSPILNRTVQTLRQPIGICAAIMPFNSLLAWVSPVEIRFRRAALRVMPSSPIPRATPHTAVEFGKLMKTPVCPVVCIPAQGFAPMSARRWCRTAGRVVSFTGRRRTWQADPKASLSERTVLAKVCLELGGKNPFVVCDDADPQPAVVAGGGLPFVDAGKRRASGSRIIVFDTVYDAFRKALVARVAGVRSPRARTMSAGRWISRQPIAIASFSRRPAGVSRGGKLIAAVRRWRRWLPGKRDWRRRGSRTPRRATVDFQSAGTVRAGDVSGIGSTVLTRRVTPGQPHELRVDRCDRHAPRTAPRSSSPGIAVVLCR